MKKWFCIVSFLLVLTMLPVVVFAQTQENNEQASSLDNQVIDTTPHSGYTITLKVDGGYLSLMLPIDFHLQEYEFLDNEEYPFSYVFVDEDTRDQYNTINNIPTISGIEVPHFLDNPLLFIPEEIKFDPDLFSKRVRGLKIRKSHSLSMRFPRSSEYQRTEKNT